MRYTDSDCCIDKIGLSLRLVAIDENDECILLANASAHCFRKTLNTAIVDFECWQSGKGCFRLVQAASKKFYAEIVLLQMPGDAFT